MPLSASRWLATIRTFGWREPALSRLVVNEGAIVGLVGSLFGAALGLVAADRTTASTGLGMSQTSPPPSWCVVGR